MLNHLADDVFENLTSLAHVDLQYNKLKSLPPNTCQDLISLKLLLLKGNSITELSDQQLEGCRKLTMIPVSSNQISHLPTVSFQKMPFLTSIRASNNMINLIPADRFQNLSFLMHLDIANNQIKVLDERTFRNLHALRTLIIASNQLLTLPKPKYIFRDLNSLKELYLQDNGLHITDETLNELFRGLFSLETLFLRNNSLTHLPAKAFGDLHFQRVITLSGNALVSLPSGLFSKSPVLGSIYVSDNMLTVIGSDLFHATSYHRNFYFQIYLSNNNLSTIPDNLFYCLYLHKTLSLSGNRLVKLDKHTFRGFKVKTLKLDRNQLVRLPGEVFQNLSTLTHLSLSHNQINELPSNIVQGLSTMSYLTLQDNHLTSLYTQFESLFSLEVLDLRDNRLNILPDTLFKDLGSLKTLHLSNNQIVNLPPLIFQSLPHLTYLGLENNYIRRINVNLFRFLPMLSVVSMSSNQLQSLNLCEFTQQLKVLDISENEIETVFCCLGYGQTLRPSISRLLLAGNGLLKFPDILLNHIKGTAYIDVSNNEMEFSSLAFTFAGKITVTFPYKTTIIYKNNKVTSLLADMSPTQYDILRPIFNSYSVDMTGNDITCDCKADDMKHILKDVNTTKINELDNEYLKTWKCFTPSYLKGKALMDVSSKDLRCLENVYGCPEKCECFKNNYDTSVLVDCSGKGLTDFPISIPEETIALNMEGNLLTFHADMIIPSYISTLSKVNLKNNTIRIIPDTLIPSLVNMQELLLSDNLITVIPQGLKQMKHTIISLGGNVLICDCHAKWLFGWILSYQHYIGDIAAIMCNSGEPLMLKPPDTFICELSTAETALIIFSIVVFFAILIVILAYTYRIEIKVFMYTRFNWHPFDNPEERYMQDKLYDAFVS